MLPHSLDPNKKLVKVALACENTKYLPQALVNSPILKIYNKSEVSDSWKMKILHISASLYVLGTSSQVLHQIAIITVALYHWFKNGRAANFLVEYN